MWECNVKLNLQRNPQALTNETLGEKRIGYQQTD